MSEGGGSVLITAGSPSGSSTYHRENTPWNLSSYFKFSGIIFYHSDTNLIHVLCVLRCSLQSSLLSCLPWESVIHGRPSPCSLLLRFLTQVIRSIQPLPWLTPSQKLVLWTQETDFLQCTIQKGFHSNHFKGARMSPSYIWLASSLCAIQVAAGSWNEPQVTLPNVPQLAGAGAPIK